MSQCPLGIGSFSTGFQGMDGPIYQNVTPKLQVLVSIVILRLSTLEVNMDL